MIKKLKGSYEVKNGKELFLRMDCETDSEFALNWLVIYNNARENSGVFLKCKLCSSSVIIVLVNEDDETVVKEWLERFGKVESCDCKYREMDIEFDYEFDTEYDVIIE